VPIEIRNATPEYDKVTLSHKLAVPAALLVAIALFAWFVFEGRLRRMAHAAAVGRGGPKHAAGRRGEEPAGYPAGYPVGYPAGPAYAAAPMVGLVPVQTYTMAYPQQPYGYPAPYGYPPAYGQQGYPMADPGQVMMPPAGMPEAAVPGQVMMPPAGMPEGAVPGQAAGLPGVDPWGATMSEPAPGTWAPTPGAPSAASGSWNAFEPPGGAAGVPGGAAGVPAGAAGVPGGAVPAPAQADASPTTLPATSPTAPLTDRTAPHSLPGDPSGTDR
jgi:hypothetical protein